MEELPQSSSIQAENVVSVSMADEIKKGSPTSLSKKKDLSIIKGLFVPRRESIATYRNDGNIHHRAAGNSDLIPVEEGVALTTKNASLSSNTDEIASSSNETEYEKEKKVHTSIHHHRRSHPRLFLQKLLHNLYITNNSNSAASVNVTSSRQKIHDTYATITNIISNPVSKKVLSILLFLTAIFLIKRLCRPSIFEEFLSWMESHPGQGLGAYVFIYALHIIILLPGTPLTMGAGYVFKITYGWTVGVILCSLITLFGSLIGSCSAFLLGRYLLGGVARNWSRKYPLFDAIDAAVSENGFKVMSMLYLTPVMPLGPVSYMMGSTSMPLKEFAKSKIAALPLTALYVFLGASTGTLVTHHRANNSSDSEATRESGRDGLEDVTLSPMWISFGILCSIGTIALITIKMKKELHKFLEKQKSNKESSDILMSPSSSQTEDDVSNNSWSDKKIQRRHYVPAGG